MPVYSTISSWSFLRSFAVLHIVLNVINDIFYILHFSGFFSLLSLFSFYVFFISKQHVLHWLRFSKSVSVCFLFMFLFVSDCTGKLIGLSGIFDGAFSKKFGQVRNDVHPASVECRVSSVKCVL